MATVDPPVAIVMSRTGTGDGLPNNTVATTPDHLPNVIIKVITPLASILIRSLRVFIQTLLGGLGGAGLVAGTGVGQKYLPFYDFRQALTLSASIAVTAAIVCALQNTGELLGDLDQRFPLLRG